jgi:hypothetical protein
LIVTDPAGNSAGEGGTVATTGASVEATLAAVGTPGAALTHAEMSNDPETKTIIKTENLFNILFLLKFFIPMHSNLLELTTMDRNVKRCLKNVKFFLENY